MAEHLVGSFPLGAVNISASAAMGIASPLIAQLDVMLAAMIGVQGDLTGQFNAAVQAVAQLSIQVTDPLAAVKAALAALASLQASISAALAASLTPPNLGLEISAAASLQGILSARLGIIKGIISAALAVKLPAVDFFAGLAANLSAGPVVVLSFDQTPAAYTLNQAGLDIVAQFTTTGVGGLVPGDRIYGVFILTKDPTVWVAMRTQFLVA